MTVSKTKANLLSFKCNIRSINGVHYIKLPPEFYNSYEHILKSDNGYIQVVPLTVGNDKTNIMLTIPKKSKFEGINEVVSYIGEIV